MATKSPRLTTQFMYKSDLSLAPRGNTPLDRCIKRVQQDHSGTESAVLKELLLLDEAYRNYFKAWLREQSLQRMAAENLWKLSKEYAMQADTMCTAPKYPSTDQDSIVSKYQVHYQIILSSNSAMRRGLTGVRKILLAFRRECGKLDLSEDTSFILGDTFHKPIKFFIDLAEELFNYFHCSYLKLDCGARHLDPSDLTAVDKYQKMLAPCEEFEEYLMHNLGYCHCLRPSQPCPRIARPCSIRTNNLEEPMRRAQQKRCARRLNKMTRLTDEEARNSAIGDSVTLNLEHELRMHQLGVRLALLRQSNVPIEGHDRTLVEQMIYALSPSLMPDGYQPPVRRTQTPSIRDQSLESGHS